MLRRLGRPRHHPARQRRRHAALPEHAGRLPAQALRHRRGDRALRHRPEQYPDIAALVGETSDNLPGIAKVGEKTAVKWLDLYGTLDGILEHADEIKGVVGQNLREQKENAVRNRTLNRLLRDVELPVGPTIS